MYSYSALLLITVSMPIVLSLIHVTNYKKAWRNILLSASLASPIFLVWDYIFVQRGYWGFREEYIIGKYLLGLPLEEIIFFWAIPFATLFFFNLSIEKKLYKLIKPDLIYKSIILISLIFAFLYFDKAYTFTAMIFTIVTSLLYMNQKKTKFKSSNLIMFFISTIPFFVVNGILTSGINFISPAPIVWYSSFEKSNIMLGSIPMEDLFFSYSMLSLSSYIYSLIK